MKGFEITVNNKEKTVAAVHSGFVLITLSSQYSLDIAGGDDKFGVSLQWKKSTLYTGDRVKIIAKDIGVITPAVSVENIDRQNLLAEYHSLKEFLIKQGRIK
ncbi:MAG: hypothetical protein LBF27_16350 [Sphingobacterium sp.]|jgi:putative ribosome biogenesis GTPase RsgA|nr:hypothetical protein [Sphingobacterium sp.]